MNEVKMFLHNLLMSSILIGMSLFITVCFLIITAFYIILILIAAVADKFTNNQTQKC